MNTRAWGSEGKVRQVADPVELASVTVEGGHLRWEEWGRDALSEARSRFVDDEKRAVGGRESAHRRLLVALHASAERT
jgi:hypothetical protein